MLQAYLPLPALYALYFFGAQGGWWRKTAHLSKTTRVLLLVSFAWATAVELTPADQRPYVGGSANNSVFNLVVSYNGIQRLVGNDGSGGAQRSFPAPDDGGPGIAAPPSTAMPGGPGDGNARGPGGGAGGAFGTGQAGPLRLFQSGLAAEASWLLPFGLLMLGAMTLGGAWRRPRGAMQRGLLVWGG